MMEYDKPNKSMGAAWLRDELGCQTTATPMDGMVDAWWQWYTSTGTFYDYTESDGKSTFKVERIGFSPARMVCEDWASILFNDRTSVGLAGVADADDEEEPDASLQAADDWLQEWASGCGILEDSVTVERCFGIGTAAWALELDSVAVDGTAHADTRIRTRGYDARSIKPISFDGRECFEAAFCRNVSIDGADLVQWTAYTRDESKSYVIRTAFFKGNGQRVFPDGFATKVETGVPNKPFAIIRPALDNAYWSGPMGVSVFDNALGPVKLADGSLDNAWKDVYLGQKLLGIPEEMLQYDDDGTATVPREKSQQLFLKMPDGGLGGGGDGKPYEYNPDLRVDQNRTAIDTALVLLGKRCGFGTKYYALDDAAGDKTAKEVASDNAELMRNAKKHEQVIGPAVSGLCEAACALARRFCSGAQGLPDITGMVSVQFGDTVVTDDDTERERMRADVAAGFVPAWKYTERFYGVTADKAKEWTGEDGQSEPVPEEA